MQMKQKWTAYMSTKQNCKSFRIELLQIKCKSEYPANRPYDRNTFNIQKPHKEENKLYLRIQRFKKFIHWYNFDPVRDLLHLLTVE